MKTLIKKKFFFLIPGIHSHGGFFLIAYFEQKC